MIATFRPSKAKGRLVAPPSKSMAHRLLICAGLSQGESLIENVDLSEDISATLDCLRSLGAACDVAGDSIRVRGADPRQAAPAVLECRECGSTLRFFIPLCLLSDSEKTLRGSKTLLARPLDIYHDICSRQNLLFDRSENSLRVAGKLCPGAYSFAGNVSSQFVSGLLFALPLLEADSSIELLPPVESRSYIELTMAALSAFGVQAEWSRHDLVSVPSGQAFRPRRIRVEGDYSNAAFFAALNFLGGEVEISGLDPNSRQGDRVYDELFAKLQQGSGVIDISDCPDLGPVLFALAAALHGGEFSGTARLRLKESDRGAAMCQELAKFGIETEAGENSIRVMPGALRRPREALCGHNDHRIVMALSLLAAQTGGRITGAEAVRKSLPGFFTQLQDLGVEVELS